MRDRNHDPFILSQAKALRAVKDEPKTPLELAIRRLPCMVGFKGRQCDDEHFLAWHPDRERHPRPAPCCGSCKRRLDEMLAADGKAAEAEHRIEMAILAMFEHADAAAWFQWAPPTVGHPRKVETEPAKIPVKPVQGGAGCPLCEIFGRCADHNPKPTLADYHRAIEIGMAEIFDPKSKGPNFPLSLSKGIQNPPASKFSPDDMAAAARALGLAGVGGPRAGLTGWCLTCHGTGEIEGRRYGGRQLYRPCPDCQPSREVSAMAAHAAGAACETCGGSGEIDQRLGGCATSGIVPCPDCGGA